MAELKKQRPAKNGGGTEAKQVAMTTATLFFTGIKWIIIIAILAGLGAGSAVAGYVTALVQDEEVRSRETIIQAMSTNTETGYVYFRDGTVIGQLRTEADRLPVEYEEIPQIVEDAVLATEDEDFYKHIGIDIPSLMRAVKQRVLNEDVQTGGSTITQQVARRVFLSLDRTEERKFKEILLAMRIERFMTKKEILTAYLNKVPFGNGASGYNLYGIKAAAKGIFNLELDELNIAQAAYLAGLPQRPSAYSAFKSSGEFDPEGFAAAKERQELVLYHMRRTGKITEEQYQEALAFDIKSSLAEPQPKAYSTYPFLMLEAERQAAEVLLRLKHPDLNIEELSDAEYDQLLESAHEELLNGGYHVYTTIDKNVYDAMHRIASNPELFTKDSETKGVEQVGGILIDNDTGAIIGMIEGRDFFIEQLNHAMHMKRQPGSAMKPIPAFLPALESGAIQPASVIDDVPILLPHGTNGVHIPKNHDRRYHGLVTARQALNQSWNIPAIRLFTEVVGIENGWNFAKQLGITTITESDYHAQTGVIGGLEYGVTVEELTNAFSSIPNQGEFVDAYFIEKITDSNGNVIYQHEVEPKRVFSEQTAYLMTDMLRTAVVNGTGYRVYQRFKYKDRVPIAGKTGTTSDSYDLWFVGYTPDVTLGIWIGYDQPARLENPNRAKFIWADVMNELVETTPEWFVTEEFPKPEGIVSKTVSRVSGLLPSELVIQEKLTVTDIFNRKYIPTKEDDVLQKASVVLVDGKAYLPQASTPPDMVKEMLVVRREEPIADLMKRIEEALDKVDSSSRLPLERYKPTDGFGDAPTEIDPRIENGKDPAPPPRVRLSKEGNKVTISFAPTSNQDVAGYRVYRSVDGGPFQHRPNLTVLTGEKYLITDTINEDRVYSYYIVAVDIGGRVSKPSEIVSTGQPPQMTSPEPGSTDSQNGGDAADQAGEAEALTAPQQLTVQNRGLGVLLEWQLNPESQGVTKYNIYYSPEESGTYTLIGSSSSNRFEYITITAAGWYRVTAVRNHQESPPSAAVQFTGEP